MNSRLFSVQRVGILDFRVDAEIKNKVRLRRRSLDDDSLSLIQGAALILPLPPDVDRMRQPAATLCERPWHKFPVQVE